MGTGIRENGPSFLTIYL